MLHMKKERKDVADRRTQIKKAITKIESEQPFQEWSPKQLKETLEKQGIIIPYRRILSHLKELEKSHYVTRNSRGSYLSATSLFYKKPLKEFLDVFTLEYLLLIQEKKVKGEQIDLQDIIEKAYQKMIEDYEADKMIQDAVGKLKRKECKE